jgi:hypothetical protein
MWFFGKIILDQILIAQYNNLHHFYHRLSRNLQNQKIFTLKKVSKMLLFLMLCQYRLRFFLKFDVIRLSSSNTIKQIFVSDNGIIIKKNIDF